MRKAIIYLGIGMNQLIQEVIVMPEPPKEINISMKPNRYKSNNHKIKSINRTTKK